MLSVAALAGCATRAPPVAAPQHVPPTWVEAGALARPSERNVQAPDAWWQALKDPVIDRLTPAAVAQSPTLAQALARIAEARALVGVQAADGRPQLSAQASLARSQSQSGGVGAAGTGSGAGTGAAGGANAAARTPPVTAGSVGFSLGWELDLWGRHAYNREAAAQRLQSQQADAQLTLLSLQSQLVDTVLAERACTLLLATAESDVQSRTATLKLTQRQLDVGAVAPSQVARAQSSVAQSLGTAAQSRGQCAQLRQALVALTGIGAAELQTQLLAPAAEVAAAAAGPGGAASAESTEAKAAAPALPHSLPQTLPQPPALRLALPATVLQQHPSVRAAAATADAAFNDLGAAEKARLPSLSLSAALSNQWLRAFGSTLSDVVWSLGASLSGVLVDGGRIDSRTEAASARYAQALAALELAARRTVQDVETSLSQLSTARAVIDAAESGVDAAQRLVTANEAAWRFGRLSLFELEDARRGLVSARTSLITARRDLAQSWVALVKATGNAVEASSMSSPSALSAPPPQI